MPSSTGGTSQGGRKKQKGKGKGTHCRVMIFESHRCSRYRHSPADRSGTATPARHEVRFMTPSTPDIMARRFGVAGNTDTAGRTPDAVLFSSSQSPAIRQRESFVHAPQFPAPEFDVIAEDELEGEHQDEAISELPGAPPARGIFHDRHDRLDSSGSEAEEDHTPEDFTRAMHDAAAAIASESDDNSDAPPSPSLLRQQRAQPAPASARGPRPRSIADPVTSSRPAAQSAAPDVSRHATAPTTASARVTEQNLVANFGASNADAKQSAHDIWHFYEHVQGRNVCKLCL
jgi:hypothetical protein